MSLHIEYECIYFLFRSKFFLFVLLVLEAVDLDDPFGLSLSLHHSDFT